MNICKEITEIERLIFFRDNIKQSMENFNYLDNNLKIITFYNLIFLTKFNNIFPIFPEEKRSEAYKTLNVEDVIKSLNKSSVVDTLILFYKEYKIKISYDKNYHNVICAIKFMYNDYKCIKLEIENNINFETDDLSEIIEQKYQLILDKLKEAINRIKMIEKNINFMKGLI